MNVKLDIMISCIEPLSQLMFHLGYEHDENDIHDVILLCEEFQITLRMNIKESKPLTFWRVESILEFKYYGGKYEKRI